MEQKRLTYDSSVATLFGCCGLFDLCSDDDILSLSLESNPFLDWLGFRPSDVCKIRKNFITWQGPDGIAAGSATEGYVSDPCAAPNTFEWGFCEWEIEDFGRLRRAGPTRTMDNPKRYCENEPRWRIDGSQVQSEPEFDMLMAAEAISQDLKRYTITGNAATGGLYDGLEQLVTNGYTNPDGRECAAMDSIVVDWNENDMAGGAGITWNGTAIGATFNFFDVLRDMFRRIRQRISYAPRLSDGINVGDMVLVMPTFMTYCLLDHFVCWRLCEGNEFDPTVIYSQAARDMRDRHNGGAFGYGYITIDGVTIPLIGYDWELIKGPTRGDIYLLTGSLGNTKLLYYEYQNTQRAVADMAGVSDKWRSFENGRFMTWVEDDETCYTRRVQIRPRMISWAPWTNIRFQDVVCNSPTGPLSPDPTESSFYFEDSFSVAECP